MKKMALLLGGLGLLISACTPLHLDTEVQPAVGEPVDQDVCLYLYENEQMNAVPEGCIPVLLNPDAPGLELAVKQKVLPQDYAISDECWWCAYQDETLNKLVSEAIADPADIMRRVSFLKETGRMINRDMNDAAGMEEALITGIIDFHFEVNYLNDAIAHTKKQIALYDRVVETTEINRELGKASASDLESARTALLKYRKDLEKYEITLGYKEQILYGLVTGAPIRVPRVIIH